MDFKQDTQYLLYTTKKKFGNQTVVVSFSGDYNATETQYYWNIGLVIYNKRKHALRNEQEARIVGQGLDKLLFAKHAIEGFEKVVVENYPWGEHIMYAHWIDNRRRNVYIRSLTRMGYTLGYMTRPPYEGVHEPAKKVLYKRLT